MTNLCSQGLEPLTNHTDLWQYVAQWKAIVDGSSSVSKQQRILVVSSQFLTNYRNVNSLDNTRKLIEQFDMVDHYLDLRSDPFEDLKEQLEDGLRWDNGSGSPWILWNAGDLNASSRQIAKVPQLGSWLLLYQCCGSVSF